jgi:membrane protease YdiL (CAAX protease family)
LAVVFEGSLIVVSVALGRLLGRSPFAQAHVGWGAVVWGAIATVPLLLGLTWALESQWGPLRRLRETVDEALAALFAGCSIVDLVVISVLAGLGEEALFRGLVQPILVDAIGPLTGLVAASVLFGLAHLVTPTYALLAGLIGLYLGWLVMTFENLSIAIVAHSLYDFVALWHLRKKKSSLATD